MPEEFAVQRSKRFALLYAALFAVIFCLCVYQAFADYSSHKGHKVVIAELAMGLLCGFGLLVLGVEAVQKRAALVVFRGGLFWPALQRDVIPWLHVENARVTNIGRGRGVAIVFSEEFEARLTASSRIGRAIMKIENWIGWKGKVFQARTLDHSAEQLAHVIDDWIRYERGLPIKPPRQRGRVDVFVDWLCGRE